MTPEQWRQFAATWERAGKALEDIERRELKNWKYDARVVDALLERGANAPYVEEEPNGLVEMQRLFMKMARRQGLLPDIAREEEAPYGAAPAKPRAKKKNTSKPRARKKHTPKPR